VGLHRLSEILAGVRNEGLSQYKLEIKLASKSGGQLIGGKRQTIY
jgi:hypothetical protein